MKLLERHAKWIAATYAATALAAVPVSSAYADRVNALVVGKISDCGGPAPGHCYPRDIVSAFNSQHRLVAKESVTNAHFSFLLRPGRYTIRVKTSEGGTAHRSVTAKAHKTVHADFHFAIR